MAASMTGYARAQHISDELTLHLSLRSVNHRFLDLQLRVPPEIEPFEPKIREAVKRNFRRGQIQLTVSLRWNAGAAGLNVNRGLVEAYLQAYRALAQEHGITAEPDLSALFRIPGALTPAETALDEPRQALLEAAFTDCLTRVITELGQVRQQEGQAMIDDMRHRALQMRQDVKQLEAAHLGTIPAFQRRLQTKLGELLGQVEIDPQRLLQEAAVLADRADISEELQRLAAHIERLLGLLEGSGDAGKQIDFLAQELNRETNTVLSKTTPLGREGLAVTEIGLRLKNEIEKIREQAQNLE